MTQEIVIEAAKRPTTNVTLVGKKYRAFPPKALVAIELQETLERTQVSKKKKKGANKGEEEEEVDIRAVLKLVDGMLGMLFPQKDVADIQARLRDSNDDLDLPEVLEVIKALTKKADPDDNPTT